MNSSGHTPAALLSIVLPGFGQLSQGRIVQALTACLTTIFLLALNMWLGRMTDRAVEVLSFMVLTLPYWALQSYDAYLERAQAFLVGVERGDWFGSVAMISDSWVFYSSSAR